MTDGIKIDIRDVKNFRKLFDDFYIPLCIFGERYIEDAECAADLVQDCFIRLWQKKEDFEYLHQLKAFLYTSVKNGALNELEHRKVKSGYVKNILEKSEETFFRDHVIEEESFRLLKQSIDKLPPQTRNIMLLALEGKGNVEIAEILSISAGTVHTHKKIAYKRLREELKEYFYVILLLFSIYIQN